MPDTFKPGDRVVNAERAWAEELGTVVAEPETHWDPAYVPVVFDGSGGIAEVRASEILLAEDN